MLFPASYKTGANKTDTGAHCPANNVVMGDGRLRKQTSGRRERLIFPRKCECECERARVPQAGRAGRGAALRARDLALRSLQRQKEKGRTEKRKETRGEGERQDSPRSHPVG